MRVGARFPNAFVSVLFMQNAALSRQEKSLVLASTLESLAYMDVAMTMRRLFGTCGGAARRNILVAEDADESLGSDKDQGAREAYRNAKNRGWNGGEGAGCRKRERTR